jgi:hypothetical protein
MWPYIQEVTILFLSDVILYHVMVLQGTNKHIIMVTLLWLQS